MDTSWDNIAYNDVLRELGGVKVQETFYFFWLIYFYTPSLFGLVSI
jgi:hypothetical protein